MPVETSPFRIEETLTTGERVAAYLGVVLEEDDLTQLPGALRVIARAPGLAEFARSIGRSPETLRADLSGERLDVGLAMELAMAVGWRLASVRAPQAA